MGPKPESCGTPNCSLESSRGLVLVRDTLRHFPPFRCSSGLRGGSFASSLRPLRGDRAGQLRSLLGNSHHRCLRRRLGEDELTSLPQSPPASLFDQDPESQQGGFVHAPLVDDPSSNHSARPRASRRGRLVEPAGIAMDRLQQISVRDMAAAVLGEVLVGPVYVVLDVADRGVLAPEEHILGRHSRIAGRVAARG